MGKVGIDLNSYFINEKNASTKHEYVDGEVTAMSGALPPHDRLVNNLLVLLLDCLEEKGCNVFSKDILIYIPGANTVRYPDLVVFCEEMVGRKQTAGVPGFMNPTLLVEVLSAGTQNIDRGQKAQEYHQISSLTHYLIVDQENTTVELYRPQKDQEPGSLSNEQSWTLEQGLYQLEETLLLFECSLPLRKIYKPSPQSYRLE